MTITPVSFPTDKHLVLHGLNNGVQYIEYEANSRIFTEQPTIEEFDDLDAAFARLEELPYPWHLYTSLWPAGKVRNPITKAWVEIPADIPEWSADETYALNAIVRHQGKEYLHSSNRQGEPDAVFSWEDGSGDWLELPYRPTSDA